MELYSQGFLRVFANIRNYFKPDSLKHLQPVLKRATFALWNRIRWVFFVYSQLFATIFEPDSLDHSQQVLKHVTFALWNHICRIFFVYSRGEVFWVWGRT